MHLDADNKKWVDDFFASNNRRPRVLHIGNIANNAYLNAKFLTARGFDCDVICYDYYHIMGCPEWEDAEFAGDCPRDHFHPDWTASGVYDFQRPKWFVQGPQAICIDYLLARIKNNVKLADSLWQELGRANRTEPMDSAVGYFMNLGASWRRLKCRLAPYLAAILNADDPRVLLQKKLRSVASRFGSLGSFLAVLIYPIVVLAGLSAVVVRRWGKNRQEQVVVNYPAMSLPLEFERLFPQRTAMFGSALAQHADLLPKWRELMGHYDAVIGYATDGVYPLLAGKHPYIAFEHGTIRNIPFVDDVQGQLCALTYRLADWVIITNADNLKAAETLRLGRYQFVPHPVNDVWVESASNIINSDYKSLHEELDSDFIIFHPSRQHWEARRHPDWEKGNDFFLRGFAAFVSKVNPKASVVLVNWGASVGDSKELIEGLGISGRVKWIEPIPNRAMMQMISACDAVADQFYLGAFGSTMPKALACGKPAILYLDLKIHEWCFPVPPPVINVRTEQEILLGLERLYSDKDFYKAICVDSVRWYEQWHSSTVVAQRLIKVVQCSIDGLH